MQGHCQFARDLVRRQCVGRSAGRAPVGGTRLIWGLARVVVRSATVDEARAEALERLVPKAIRVLEEHLDSGRPDAWRSACRILDHSWGRPAEHVEVDSPPEGNGDELNLDKLSTAELEQRVRARRAVLRAAERREPESANAASSSLSG